MPKLTKEQKKVKRFKKYAEALDRIDHRAYGGHECFCGGEEHWTESYRGYPQGQKFTEDYGRRHGHG